jgi:hypothetical protein
MKTIIWDRIRISGGTDSIISKAAKKMVQNEALITQWAPALLLMELNNVLWKDADNISIKKLWEYLCTYCYLPRLAGYEVLENAICTGVNSTEYFALAAGIDGERYVDLKFNHYIGIIDRSGLLVKIAVAKKQIAEVQRTQQPGLPAGFGGGNLPPVTGTEGTGKPYPPVDNGGAGDVKDPTPTELPKNTHFYMSALLDNTRINRDVQKLVEEVISHLTSVDGCHVEVTLELNAKAPKGLPHQIVRTVTENCRTLKVKDFGFDE